MNHTKLCFTLGLMLYVFFISGCSPISLEGSPFQEALRVDCGDKGILVEGFGGGLCDGDPYLYMDTTNGTLGVLSMNKRVCESAKAGYWLLPTELQSRK